MRKIEKVMPAMVAHEGVWEGRYRHTDLDGTVEDEYASRIECVFPASGPYDYVQRNRYAWADGRVREYEFGGVLRGERLYWDTETFAGHAWTTGEGMILLTLERKDDPGAMFHEIILLGDDGRHRVRTWHWFREGRPFRLTLCNERRTG